MWQSSRRSTTNGRMTFPYSDCLKSPRRISAIDHTNPLRLLASLTWIPPAWLHALNYLCRVLGGAPRSIPTIRQISLTKPGMAVKGKPRPAFVSYMLGCSGTDGQSRGAQAVTGSKCPPPGVQGRAVISAWRWFNGRPLTMGVSGELGGSPEWRSGGQTLGHGPVQVERPISRSCERVSRGGGTPFDRWGPGESGSLPGHGGVGGSRRVLRRVANRRYGSHWRLSGLNTGRAPAAGGCNGGAPAGPLAKIVW